MSKGFPQHQATLRKLYVSALTRLAKGDYHRFASLAMKRRHLADGWGADLPDTWRELRAWAKKRLEHERAMDEAMHQ